MLPNGQSEIHRITSRDTSRSKICAGQIWRRIQRTGQPLGVTITVARQQSNTVSELSFLTAVHTAQGIASAEGISEVFACK